MIARVIRDEAALSSAPLDAVVVKAGGSEEDWGSGSGAGRDLPSTHFATPSELVRTSELNPVGIVIVAGAAIESGVDEIEGDALLTAIYRLTVRACIVECVDRVRTAAGLRAAGFARVGLIEPPADAERSFVVSELSILVARHEEQTPR